MVLRAQHQLIDMLLLVACTGSAHRLDVGGRSVGRAACWT
jgi:hypothetical protein